MPSSSVVVSDVISDSVSEVSPELSVLAHPVDAKITAPTRPIAASFLNFFIRLPPIKSKLPIPRGILN